MLWAGLTPPVLWFGILSPQFTMTRMLLSTGLRKFLLVPSSYTPASSSARTPCPVGAGDVTPSL